MYLNGEDVSEKIRLPEISMAASRISALPEVRSFLYTNPISRATLRARELFPAPLGPSMAIAYGFLSMMFLYLYISCMNPKR